MEKRGWKRRGEIIVLARTWSSPPRTNETKPPRMLANNDLHRVIQQRPRITVNGPCNEPESFCRFIASSFLSFPRGKRRRLEQDIWLFPEVRIGCNSQATFWRVLEYRISRFRASILAEMRERDVTFGVCKEFCQDLWEMEFLRILGRFLINF